MPQKPAKLPSPCVGICTLNDAGTECVGCLRTPEQIRLWPLVDDNARLAILNELKARRDQRLGRKRPKRRPSQKKPKML